MSRRYVLSPLAQDDRDGIFDYTALRSGDVEVAFRVDQKLEKTLDDIGANPTIGHTRIDLGIPDNLLVRAVYSYLVIYNPKTRPVRILRIWHGAQETPAIPETWRAHRFTLRVRYVQRRWVRGRCANLDNSAGAVRADSRGGSRLDAPLGPSEQSQKNEAHWTPTARWFAPRPLCVWRHPLQ